MASEIRVDKINSLSGVGTVTLSPTGIDIAGVTTAATLRATTGIVTTLTATSSAKVGSGVTLSSDGDVFVTGITTFGGAVTGSGGFVGNVTGNVTGNQSGGSVSATSAAVADLTSGRVVLVGASGELQDDSSLLFGSNQLTVHQAKLKGNQLLFEPSGTAYIDHYTTGQDVQFRTSVSSSLDTTGPTIKSNGNIAFVSGKGIDFSSTGDSSGTMSSELLDDYEEGTFTPSFTQGVSGGSYSFQSGHYTKVGRLVMVSMRIDGSGLSANSNNLLLGGLPFTTVASGGTAGGLYFAYSDNFYSGSSGTNLALTIIVNNNATVCEFFDGDGTQKNGTDFYDVNRNIHIVGTYHAAQTIRYVYDHK